MTPSTPTSRSFPLALAAAAVLLASTTAHAETRPAATDAAVAAEAQPAAREILQRSIDAIGGQAVLDSIEAIHFAGRFSMPAQGMAGTVEAWEAPPDRMLVRIELPGLGKIETGQAGGTGWSIDPMQGPRLLSDAELTQASLGQTLLRDSDPMALYSEASVAGRESFEGRDAWKLDLVLQNGTAATGWFDVETGRQLGLKTTQVSQMGEIPVTIVMEDYRSFGPLTLPARTVSRITAMGMGMEQILTIDTVTVDPETLPDFQPPPAIRELLPAAQ